MDTIIPLVAIITSVSSLIISILTHIKTSKCFGMSVRTTQSTTPSITPIEKKSFSEHIEPNVLLSPNKITVSSPIPIPPSTPLLTRANFL